MITLTLDWHEVLWFLAGAMQGSHLRWSAYEDMVNRVWPQCTEQERRCIFFIMRRDLGYWWRPEGFNGSDRTMKGEGPWKADDDGYAIDRTDPDAKPRQVITDLTPWMYFRQVLARFDPDRQVAVTIDCTVEDESPFGDGDALFSQMMHEKSVRQATVMARDAMAKGILMPYNLIDRQQIEAERPSVTVRAYEWQGDYHIDWNKRCDADRIVSVEKIMIPDTG